MYICVGNGKQEERNAMKEYDAYEEGLRKLKDAPMSVAEQPNQVMQVINSLLVLNEEGALAIMKVAGPDLVMEIAMRLAFWPTLVVDAFPEWADDVKTLFKRKGWDEKADAIDAHVASTANQS